MGILWPNLRHTARLIVKNPGFAAVAVLSLALGIGANTAIFTLMNALLLRSLPVRHPESLVEISVVRRGDKIPLSFPMFREIARGQRVFSGLMGWSFGGIEDVQVGGALSQADVRSVTGNYYMELGATPLLGRLITPHDVTSGGTAVAPVAVLSYDYWERRFGSASDAIGRQIAIEGQPFTIIGVARRWFTGMAAGEAADVTVPMKGTEERSQLWVFATGRLKDGVTLAKARAQLESFWPEVLRATASTEAPGLRRQAFFSMGIDVAPAARGVNASLRKHFTRPLYVLLGIVVLILLLACVNLANLTLARTAARRHEMSVRAALGANRVALAAEVLAESLVLSGAGALLGFAFAYWGSGLLLALLTQTYPTPVTLDLRPDGRVLALTAALAALTGILFGLVPAWRCSREDPALVLQQGARSVAGAAGKSGQALIVTQVVLSLTLLLGAALLVQSFRKLISVDPGLADRVLEVSLHPRPGGYDSLDMNRYHCQLIERVANLPGVASVAFSDVSIPGDRWQDTVSTMTAASSPNAGVMALVVIVSPDLFRTLRIGLVRGRSFDWTDDERHPRVAIVSRALAGRLSRAGNGVGQLIRFGFMPELQNLEVVGVASDARLFDLRDRASSVVYVPYQQHPDWTKYGSLFVRTNRDPEALARSVARAVESLGHEYAVESGTVAQHVSQALADDRAIAALSSFFAGVALLLAAIGLYGLMSYGVARRTREIGIRAALGAGPGTILWLIQGEALALVLAGIAVGIPCALAAGHLLRSLLFGISPGDWPTVGVASLLLLTVAFLASYMPARRATRIDPMVAVRDV